MKTTANAIKPDALGAWLALLMALFNLTDRGQSTPCLRDPELFTSDDQLERAEAAAACQHCPALAPCREYANANAEPAHVWAGVDRTPTTRRTKDTA